MPTFRFEFDPSGQDPNNLVPGEIHTIAANTARIVVPIEGSFYTSSVNVELVSNPGVPLILGTDYTFEGFDPIITTLTGGNEVAGIISFQVNTGLSGDISLTYQAVGGAEGNGNRAAERIATILEDYVQNGVPFEQINLNGNPLPVPEHTHNIVTDLTELNPINNAVLSIAQSLLNRQPFPGSVQEITDLIQGTMAIVGQQRNELNQAYALIDELRQRLDNANIP